MEKLHFECDYMRGCHPDILLRLCETNAFATPGYGADGFTQRAERLILDACGLEKGEVFFLVGGTQTNATVIDALLRRTQGVLAADTSHINVHEAGAIEADGHKVITLPARQGKIRAQDVERYIREFYADATHPHIVSPGMVYVSQPTELGSLYTLEELENLGKVCAEAHIPLYLDGARLAYALAAPGNKVSLEDVARICDIFYIGGTKCGALFGEAVVTRHPDLLRGFFSIAKSHGAVLAKGRLLGVQFETLFRDGLYYRIGEHGIRMAMKLREGLVSRGVKLYAESYTNQQFFLLSADTMERLSEKVGFELWGTPRPDLSPVRFVTDWSTSEEDVEALIGLF